MNEQKLLELKLKINETEKKIENLKEDFEQDYDPDHAEIYEEDIEAQEKILKDLQLEYKNAFEKTKPIIKNYYKLFYYLKINSIFKLWEILNL